MVNETKTTIENAFNRGNWGVEGNNYSKMTKNSILSFSIDFGPILYNL